MLTQSNDGGGLIDGWKAPVWAEEPADGDWLFGFMTELSGIGVGGGGQRA